MAAIPTTELMVKIEETDTKAMFRFVTEKPKWYRPVAITGLFFLAVAFLVGMVGERLLHTSMPQWIGYSMMGGGILLFLGTIFLMVCVLGKATVLLDEDALTVELIGQRLRIAREDIVGLRIQQTSRRNIHIHPKKSFFSAFSFGPSYTYQVVTEQTGP